MQNFSWLEDDKGIGMKEVRRWLCLLLLVPQVDMALTDTEEEVALFSVVFKKFQATVDSKASKCLPIFGGNRIDIWFVSWLANKVFVIKFIIL